MANEKALCGREISAILRACKKAGVQSLQYGGLHVTFHPSAKEIAESESQYIYIPTESVDTGAESPIDHAQKPPVLEDSEDQDLMLAVVDPVAWENKHLGVNSDV